MKDANQNPNIIVRQKFSTQLIPRETPLIQVAPLTRTEACEPGKQVVLSCSVQEPFMVKFIDFPEAGSGDI